MEIGFHAGVLRARSDVNVVLHFQSPAATTLACSNPEAVNFNVIAEVPYYIGPIAVVPFIAPGSAELASAVTAALVNRNMAVLRNHGLVTVGGSYEEATQRAVFFELACRIIVDAGDRLTPLSSAEVVIASGGGA